MPFSGAPQIQFKFRHVAVFSEPYQFHRRPTESEMPNARAGPHFQAGRADQGVADSRGPVNVIPEKMDKHQSSQGPRGSHITAREISVRAFTWFKTPLVAIKHVQNLAHNCDQLTSLGPAPASMQIATLAFHASVGAGSGDPKAHGIKGPVIRPARLANCSLSGVQCCTNPKCTLRDEPG